MKQSILVVGGAGYIGSHVNKLLSQEGCDTVVLDNLSRGRREAIVSGTFIEGDIGDSRLLDDLFLRYRFDAVMHFAALIDVGESVVHPDLYYVNNVARTLTLLQAMLRHNVKTLVFSSTAAIYGLPKQTPIGEDHPCVPINPYGESKWMVEKILRDLDKAYGLRFCCLRYFNAAGGDPEGIIKNHRTQETNLIPIALLSLLQAKGAIRLFGTDYPTPDGTCIRDYIHIYDIGLAHLAALKRLFAGAPSDCFNLGNGQGFSVREVLQAVERVTHRPLQVIESSRRPGDPPILVADARKATQVLGWVPRYRELDSMIAHAWQALDIGNR